MVGKAEIDEVVSKWTGVPIASIAVDHYSLAANPSLPAIPLFTMAGYFLAESGSPKRLIELFDALFGRFRGGRSEEHTSELRHMSESRMPSSA